MVKRALFVLMLVAGSGMAVVWRWLPPPLPSSAVAATLPATGKVPAAVSARLTAGGLPPRAWSVVGGQLVPGRSLRERFDSYLPLGRGVTMVEVRATLSQDARADLGAANGDRVLALWDNYARLQTYEWRTPFNTVDPKSWQATLDEQRAVRRRLLGREWAEAFFAADEVAMQQRLSRALALRKPGKPSLDDLLAKASPAAGPAAASRVGSVADPDWQHRIDDARQEWARLVQDPALDEGQRLLTMRRYLQLNFSASEGAQVASALPLP